jgi:glutaredoxin
MITLYRTPDCPQCDGIQSTLEDLCIRHEVVLGTRAELRGRTRGDGSRDAKLPCLVDDGETFAGGPAILEHLDGLADFATQWRKYQSDACYCDEEDDE